MKDALGDKRCKSCRAYNQPNEERPGICVMNPATVLFMGMLPLPPPKVLANPKAPPMQQLQPMVQTVFPEMHPESGCLKWEAIPPGLEKMN